MCWVMPPASPSATLALRILSSSERLAVVDVTHDGHHGRPRLRVEHHPSSGQSQSLLELDLLLLARVDEPDLGADVGGEELDHVVGERLGRRDHLALLHEEPYDVGAGAVQLGTESWADVARSMTISPSGTGASVGV